MNNVRKIATVAVAGIVVSSFVSANRKIIGFILRSPKRSRQIAELRQWYEAELLSVDAYAERSSHSFVEENSEFATDEYLESLQVSIREFIRLDQKAALTREYGIRLYDFDSTIAYEQEQEAAELMAQRDDVSARMRMAEYPIEALYSWLLAHKRT